MDASIFVALLLGLVVIGVVARVLIVVSRAAEKRRRDRLSRETASGTATIIGVTPTHSSAGERPIVKLRLRVSFEAEAEPREVELDLEVHALDAHRLQLGAIFPTRFDPQQIGDFSVDFGGVTGVVPCRLPSIVEQ